MALNQLQIEELNNMSSTLNTQLSSLSEIIRLINAFALVGPDLEQESSIAFMATRRLEVAAIIAALEVL